MNEILSLKKELAMYRRQASTSTIETNGEYRTSRRAFDLPENDKSDDYNYRKPIDKQSHAPQDSSPKKISVNSSVNRLAVGKVMDSFNVAGADSFETASSLDGEEKTRGEMTSPNPVTPESDEESIPISIKNSDPSDFAFGELHSEDFFHYTYQNTLPATPEKDNVDVDAMNEKFNDFLSMSQKSKDHADKKGMVGIHDSIDAFEASFQTEFPSSFVESTSPSTASNFSNSAFSDSFFMTTSKADRDGNVVTTLDEDVVDFGSITVDELDAPLDEALSLFPDTFGPPLEDFETPRKQKPPTTGNNISNPSANGMNANASSKSNTERRRSDEDAPMDEVKADDDEHSPSLVLKRLQQRKVKQSNSPNGSTGSSSFVISEEMEKLDAIATGLPALREKRRSVKQPISYAEPALNSKLRRGDVFFPKHTDDEINRGASNDKKDSTMKDRHNTNKAIRAELRAT
jgi:hypothetical protein